jgi:hypothetical protein
VLYRKISSVPRKKNCGRGESMAKYMRVNKS